MMRHLIEIVGGVVGGRLRLRWAYSRSRHRTETIQHVADDFIAVLRSIVEASEMTADENRARDEVPRPT